ncbi:MAG: ribose-5-phosphate isomerase RpiA [Anaerolineae bacterium]|nr:ribose-5-phosphate isomerase RpiA [Anaerolineae bacterium]
MNQKLNLETLKRKAGEYAVQYIQSGMVIGLGHGSTAVYAIRKIAQLLQEGALEDILAVPCSLNVEAEVRKLCIPMTTLDEHPVIDVTIDGADEVDPNLNVIKGGGGALLREKIVAQATRREIIVIDSTKLVPQLGTQWAVPIEVVQFGLGANMAYLATLGAEVTIRKTDDGKRFISDQGNLIVDANFGPMDNPTRIAALLGSRAGIVEHGLFMDLVTDVIVAKQTGIKHLTAQ